MRARVFLLFLSSCAVVSGLDGLTIDDGGIDAPIDAPADVAVDQGLADASPDSSGDVTPPTMSDGIHCATNTCVDQKICCGFNNGGGNYTFSCETSCDASVRLACDDPTECEAGLVCCIVSDVVTACAQQCTTTLEMCSGPGQCPKGSSCVPYDGGLMQKIGASHCQ